MEDGQDIIDLQGNLKVFDPSIMFQLVNFAQASGEMVFQIESNTASIYFNQGKIIFATLETRPTLLGEYLVEKGYVSQAKLDAAWRTRTKGQRVGDCLVDHGLIDRNMLKAAVQEQIKEVIYFVVRWHSGRFFFIAGKMPEKQDILINLPLDTLMLEGIKRLDEARVR